MPADNLPLVEPREFVRNIANVLKLLQPTQVYLIPTVSAVEAENTWPPERNMVVWKDVAGAWYFKIQVLGEQHQGMFDISIEDDLRVVDCLNTLEINPEASEEISDKLGPDLLARIARPYLSLSYSQQNQIIVPLDLSAVWPLDSDGPIDTTIQTCLALLRGEQEHDFSMYLTLARINQLAGGRVAEFCSTNPNVTSGDVLRFIQLLMRAAINKIGHDEAVVLPALPEGSERRYGDVDHDGDALLIPEIHTAIECFEVAFIVLEASVPHLSENDRQRLAQSLTALRAAKTTWFNSNKGMDHLLSFRRATDAVLHADHIQRLYTHQRYPGLGMFSDYVASPETPALQQLQLSLRELRDFSQPHVNSSQYMEMWRKLSLVMQCFSAGFVLLCMGDVGVLALLALPAFGVLMVSLVYGMCLADFLLDTFIMGCTSEFSLDLWTAVIEMYREFIAEDIPRALGVVLVISVGYGLIAGELSVATGLLAMAGMVFASSCFFTSAVYIGLLSVVAAGYVGYQAVSYMADILPAYFEDWSSGFNPDEPVHEGVEGTGLAPT
tara:strand:- start:10202 stop:11860 length:1659 start_codon:yes stop_codon:yes gene_type:complete